MINETIDLLGRRARDRVTGFVGVIESVGFDLYGCVQAIVRPPVTADGKREDCGWFDVQRLEILAGDPVMQRPDFAARAITPAAYDHGAAEKPIPSRHP